MSKSDPTIEIEPKVSTPSRKPFVALVVALVVASAIWRLLYLGELEQTAALFILLPGVLAILLARTGRSTNAVGAICKGMALFLLLSGILLGEGIICILIASPIFFGVGIAVGAVIDAGRRRRNHGADITLKCSLVLIALLGFEGVHSNLSFPRDEQVTVRKEIEAPMSVVREALAAPMDFDDALPLFFRAGFPYPVGMEGSGLTVGRHRKISFSTPPNSNLLFSVTESSEDTVVFEAVEDTSKIAHWLGWQRATVKLTDLGNNRTDVQWTIDYERRLDPVWYFGPIERFAVSQAAGYLIDTLATPDGDGE